MKLAMTTMTVILGAVLLSSVGVVPASRADDVPEYATRGIYLGGGLGIGIPTSDIALVENDDLVTKTVTGLGADVWLGYRVIPRLALEVQYEYIANIEVVSKETNPRTREDLSLMTFTGNAKAFATTGAVQIYGLLGGGMMWSDQAGVDESGPVLRGGGGIDLYITPKASVGGAVTYVYGFSDVSDTDYVSIVLGAQYRF